MSDIKWIKIDTGIFNHPKIKLIRALPDGDLMMLIWIQLLTTAGECNAMGNLILTENIPYTAESLATLFNRPLNTMRLALKTFEEYKMIEINDCMICILNWEKHQNEDGMEKIREQNKERKRRQRAKQKLLLSAENNTASEKNDEVPCDVTGQVTKNSRDVTQQNKKEKENKIKNLKTYKEQKLSSNEHLTVETFFDKIWAMYPNKNGKSKITKVQKEKLYKHGDEIYRCIERYLSDPDLIINGKWKTLQQGSTFFKTTYLEYLDKEYKNREVVNQKTPEEIKKERIITEAKRRKEQHFL